MHSSIGHTTDLINVMTITVAVEKSQATIVRGEFGSKSVDMLDFGSSVSLIQSNILTGMKNASSVPDHCDSVTTSEDQPKF